jgi:hypothetical protein
MSKKPDAKKKYNIFIATLLTAWGVVWIAAAYFENDGVVMNIFSKKSGFIIGFILLARGVVRIAQNIKFLKDKELLKKDYINKTDERNLEIVRDAWQATGKLSVCGLFIAAMFTAPETAKALYITACGMMVLFCAVYFIRRKWR